MKKPIIYICIALFLIQLSGCHGKKEAIEQGVEQKTENEAEEETDDQLLHISLQQRVPSKTEKGSFIIADSARLWNPLETAVIISDMWDKHWCPSATARVAEIAPVMNDVLTILRGKGVTIVHAPSNCMNYYKDHTGRKEALKYSDESLVALADGVSKLPSEAGATWPIDDSDEGCDSSGAKPHTAWTKQIGTLDIGKKDIISDNGAQIGAYFKSKGIKNVILMGVHTNMCVMHRSFGLRAMKRMGMNVVLMRDMTDLMYNPESYPYTSHWNGLNLMVEYIEKYICPTVISSDITGKEPFVFTEAKNNLK